MLSTNTNSLIQQKIELISTLIEKNKGQILALLASLKAQGIIHNYGNVYTDSEGIHFSLQPFYPIFPYFKFDVAT
jgi:hypothetical protein